MPTRTKPRPKPVLTAANSDRHILYQIAVQCPESEIDFVDGRFRKLRGRPVRRLREDFCGTAHTASHFVTRHKDNTAVGLDLDAPTLAWGEKNNLSRLTPEQRSRLTLLKRNVLDPRDADRGFDAILAMNFSYWIFNTRPTMRAYFEAVRKSLKPDGILFMDTWGGYESMKEQQERRRCPGGFTYIWDQAHYDPLTGQMTCHIHFDFKKGPMWKKAFTYTWRLWTVPELRELLAEAGFRKVTIYWEGENKHGNGNGVFSPRAHGVADASFISYITAEK